MNVASLFIKITLVSVFARNCKYKHLKMLIYAHSVCVKTDNNYKNEIKCSLMKLRTDDNILTIYS